MGELPMDTTNETHEDIEVYKTILEKRIRKIVEEHFQLYLDGLFSDLEIIEKKITIVKKYLRLIRDHVKSNTSDLNADKSDQSITPFNKKYLKRRTYGTRRQVQKEQQTSSDSSAQVGKVKEEVTSSQSKQAIFKEKRYVPQTSTTKKVSLRGQRFKECKTFIVGNVSQALQPNIQQQQMFTHRWLLYVRGPKTCPDISEYVSCVRFYLHESYKPDDVVNVRKPPFHVSRRGWGAFLTKVVIFFKLEKNKPMQIFHKLQLDTSFSGMQTFGGETVVKKWIYLYDPRMFIKKRARSTSPSDPDENEEEAPLVPSADVLRIHVEHNYSKCVFTLQAPREARSDKCVIIRDNPSQVFPLKFVPLNQQSSKIKRPVSPKQNMNCYVEKLNKAIAKCAKLSTAQAVGWLLEIMPAVTANAANHTYKMLHPYSAVSLKEFHSWNEAKKYFHTIYRCKLIENFLRRAGVKVWSYRRIFNYARKRGYIPLPSILTMKNQGNVGKVTPLRKFPYQRKFSVLKKRRKRRRRTKVKKSENKVFKNACTEPTEILEYIKLNETVMDSNEEVEILYLNPVSGDEDDEICELCDLPETLLLFHSYISKHLNLLNCLWRSKLTNSALISIAVAARIFVKDLFRRSLRKAWTHYIPTRNLPISICTPDVTAALRRRKEFDFLLHDGLGLRGEFHYE